jgi:hypothetical protein
MVVSHGGFSWWFLMVVSHGGFDLYVSEWRVFKIIQMVLEGYQCVMDFSDRVVWSYMMKLGQSPEVI